MVTGRVGSVTTSAVKSLDASAKSLDSSAKYFGRVGEILGCVGEIFLTRRRNPWTRRRNILDSSAALWSPRRNIKLLNGTLRTCGKGNLGRVKSLHLGI